MKRFLLTLALFIISSLSLTTPSVLAAGAGGAAGGGGTLCPGGQYSTLCNLKIQQGSNIVGSILTVLLILAVILCVIFLIWGGIRWIMSNGDQAKVTSARGTITAAIVGLVIALFAFTIVSVITYFVTGQNLGNLSIPTLY